MFSNTLSIDIGFQPHWKAISKKPPTWFVFLWSIVLFSHRRSLLRQMLDRNLLSFIIRFFWVDGSLPREDLYKLHWERQKDFTVNFCHFFPDSILSELHLRWVARYSVYWVVCCFHFKGEDRICIFKWFFTSFWLKSYCQTEHKLRLKQILKPYLGQKGYFLIFEGTGGGLAEIRRDLALIAQQYWFTPSKDFAASNTGMLRSLFFFKGCELLIILLTLSTVKCFEII